MKKRLLFQVLLLLIFMSSSQMVSAQDGGELSLEEQKRIIEASYDGGIVHEAIVMDEETLIFYDGKEWQELSALEDFNGNPIPWGEIYSFDNPEDIAKLKEISAQEAEKVKQIDIRSEKFPEMKFIQFYPDNDSWERDENVVHTLSGYFIINIDGKSKVIDVTTSPYRSLSLYQDVSTGAFSTSQITTVSGGNGLKPLMIGISPRYEFEIGPDGFSNMYMTDLKTEDMQNWLGAEDLDLENIDQFIEQLKNGKIPVFHIAIQTGTLESH